MPYFGASGGTSFNQYVTSFKKKGPSSYATGGFVLDLTDTYSSLNYMNLTVQKGQRGSFPYGRIHVALNSPSAGKATVSIYKFQYLSVSSYDNIAASSQPSGVTVQSTSGQTSGSESTHVHDMTHNHVATTSGAFIAGGAGIDNGTPSVNHTHSVDIPNFVANTGAGSSHNHTDNTIYHHNHSLTFTTTNLSHTELANATDLSATTFLVVVTGARA